MGINDELGGLVHMALVMMSVVMMLASSVAIL